MSPLSRSSAFWLLFHLLLLQVGNTLLLAGFSYAQSQSNTSHPTTFPAENEALLSIMKKWNLNMKWNTTDDPCSGQALVESIVIDNTAYDPFIKCACNDTTCHITALKVYSLDVTGSIPDEIWSLTYLTNLNLAQNYLTGSLSPSVGNLTNLQYLTVGINALSGNLPSELGKLTNIISLSFSSNNFSGPLPSEIGNLKTLQKLYISSSGVSGEIPSTFADLENLEILWASDTELNGTVPNFIGNLTKLTDLRIQGSSLVGPIPSNFANLTSLETLRISEISGEGASLEFLTNMKSVTTLVLRNSNFSGSIPSVIGELPSLSYLDLSFNNLTGRIPDSLFDMNSLTYMFLGNNKLTGSLPEQKSASLLNIDVSYNELSGEIPSWVDASGLQLNLVANNFTSTSMSALTSGLNCLQKGFPCHRDSPIYSSFAIKCGGPQISSAELVTYEEDKDALGPATYHVTENERWGVSNAGWFLFSNNASYTTYSPSQFTNTLDSEIFQTSRLSPGSLRYYGLGLENGNYSVDLFFAEVVISDGQTWKSLGRRKFNIYIQGNPVEENFDIRKEAGGKSFRAVKKSYTTLVAENYLEIHLFWAGKGTCCIPSQGTYGPSISAISVTPNFKPTVANELPSSDRHKTIVLILAIALPVGFLCILLLVACHFARKKRGLSTEEDKELLGKVGKQYTYSYSELRSATDDFSSANKLGEGGFGPVYKGTLNDGRAVAVKQLSFSSHQGTNQFIAEIATISAVQHRNLVKLYGCCIEDGKRMIVYEYLENRSLDQALFGKNKSLVLDWMKRFEICKGVARGLSYLHQESSPRIVHRDVKASNILLDSELNPKISDFGLAKLYDDKVTHISTGVAGTIGYVAPEYAMRGHLTEKVDVFSFGVLALEIVSGRPNADTNMDKEKIYLLEWTWQLYEEAQEIQVVDRKLQMYFNEEEAKRVIRIGLLCTQSSPAQRPSMSRVIAMLSGDVEVGTVPSKPSYLTDCKFDEDSNSISTANTAAATTPTTTTSGSGNTAVGSRPSELSIVSISDCSIAQGMGR